MAGLAVTRLPNHRADAHHLIAEAHAVGALHSPADRTQASGNYFDVDTAKQLYYAARVHSMLGDHKEARDLAMSARGMHSQSPLGWAGFPMRRAQLDLIDARAAVGDLQSLNRHIGTALSYDRHGPTSLVDAAAILDAVPPEHRTDIR